MNTTIDTNKNFEDYNIINVKIDNKEQVISKFSYDENDKLNKEFSEFILDKTKTMNLTKNIKLNFYTPTTIEPQEIKTTIYNHFREEYLEFKHELKRTNIFTLIMLVLGILSLSFLILAHKFFDYFYFTTILEIASWVFVWECVDGFFLKNSHLRQQCLVMKKLYSSEIEIIKTK